MLVYIVIDIWHHHQVCRYHWFHTLSLSLSLYIYIYMYISFNCHSSQIFDGTQYPHRADECKVLLDSQHWFIQVQSYFHSSAQYISLDLTCIVCVKRGKRPDSCNFVECCFQNLFKLIRSIHTLFRSSFFLLAFHSSRTLNFYEINIVTNICILCFLYTFEPNKKSNSFVLVHIFCLRSYQLSYSC